MTHDQLARVFPDGRTVHVPSDGNPLKNYQLALADIEKRGDGDDASAPSKSGGLLATLFKGFKGKSNDEDDEGAAASVTGEKVSPASVIASAAPTKSADPIPMPRSKPGVAAAFQLASADVAVVQPPKPKQAAAASAEKSEPKPETPADIINARGFWDAPATPKQATPEQVAAVRARQAVAGSDPQSTASVSAAFQALAYAPPAGSPVDRANIVAASAPIPRSIRPASVDRSALATGINTVAAKGPQGQASLVATSTRIAAARGSDVWMRVLVLAPSAATSMTTTVLGDVDLTSMRVYFVKPPATVAMSFSDDPLMGLLSERFTGSATARLETTSFVTRTAALR
jgi:hypothetical protein